MALYDKVDISGYQKFVGEMVQFNPVIKTVGELSEYEPLAIRDEPMLFSCDLDTARKLGGNITQEFIDKIDAAGFFNDVPDD